MKTTTKSKKIKRQIPFLVFNAYNEEHFETIENEFTVQDKIYTDTVESISHAIAEGCKTAELFKLQDYYSVITLSRNDFKSVLENAMAFYAKHDNFDKAIECQGLIQLI